MEKLASGLRINRAGDDAAGLAISEKMRAQVRGLDQAAKNSQDGISMIQTAEGALNETHDILQRMRELATQAANDTNVTVDRGEIQKEINQLSSEINRIGNTTEFNTQSLLKGDGTNKLESLPIDLSTIDTVNAGTDLTTTESKLTVDLGAVADGNKLSVTLNGRTIDVTFKDQTATAAVGDITYDSTSAATINIENAVLAGGDDAAVSASTVKALQQLIDNDSDLKGNYKVTAAGAGAFTIEAVKTGDFAGSKGNISWNATTVGQFTVTDGAAPLAANTKTFGADTAATAANTVFDLTGFNSAAKIQELVGKGLTINGQQIEFYDANKGAYNGNVTGINISGVTDGTGLAAALTEQLKLDGVTATDDGAGELTLTSNTKGAASKVTVTNGGEAKKRLRSYIPSRCK
ncbi:flagellin protein [Lysinibacillus boronitolerans]|uniref:flagellin N-terminal helical domain-containing protein n=1 Tax=Lysinibacillus boronitolerans TaxID=309788 RepID=UPI001EE6722C|nr:flagellin protein [Lysinibacillus boronitolerans]